MVSCVGRLEVPTFFDLDGTTPPSLPCSPPPPTSGEWPPTKEEVVNYHRMMSKKCCLCDFNISDPDPQEGRLCGLRESMWDNIEECHPEKRDWFDETSPLSSFDREAWALSIPLETSTLSGLLLPRDWLCQLVIWLQEVLSISTSLLTTILCYTLL